jgi:hypothetical protein
MLVRFAPRSDGRQQAKAERLQLLSSLGGAILKRDLNAAQGLCLIELPVGLSVEDALKLYNKSDDILYAEPDYRLELAFTTPNDNRFNELWGMHNTGQTGGTADADIDAPEAWDIATAADSVIVAVIDTGVDYNHEDLSPNIWTNQTELNGDPNVDDDNNGYIDDVRGWDFFAEDNDPMDYYGHGTHCAGTIGSVGNNAKGVTGVCWNMKLMALQVSHFDQEGWGIWASNAAEAIKYAVDNGAKVLSNSWGGSTDIQSLRDAVEYSQDAGVLFIASAGNDGVDNDYNPHYPSSCGLDNIISVMATDHNDERSIWSPVRSSNWGQTSVDLAAPGSDILSCLPGNNYGYASGTSMAAPYVAGACALVWAANPGMNHWQVKEHILQSVDRPQSLEGLCVSEGRLNLYNALTYIPPFELSKEDSLEGSCLPTRGEIIYTINYKYIWNDPNDPNAPTSPGDPTEVKIIDFLPEEVTFDDWASDNGVYNEPNHAVVWNIGSLAPGAKGSVQLKARTNQRVLPAGMIANWCKMRGKIGQYNYSETSKLSTAVCDCSRCGEVVYVDKNVAVPGDGSSWSEAFDNLQNALAAVYPCDEIWVADGTYKPTTNPGDPNATFTLGRAVSLYGGFAGGESHRYERNWLDSPTTLSGQINANNVNYVVTLFDTNSIPSTAVDGFVITGGTIAGIYCPQGAPVIQHNRVTNNIRGILCADNAAAAIRNNWIYGNAEGIRLDGAGSETIIRNNTIVYNSGIGVNRISGSEPIITNCIFWGHPGANNLAGCSASFSCLEDPNNCRSGSNGNIIGCDPKFHDVGVFDYHLAYNSPCIDKGNPDRAYGPYFGESDIDHRQRRIASGRVDMGADEYCDIPVQGSGGGEITPDLYSEDEEAGRVTFKDCAVLAAAWLSDPNDGNWNANCDLVVDDIINLRDLNEFVADWLELACWTTPLASEIDFMIQAGGGGGMMSMGMAGGGEAAAVMAVEGGLAAETSVVYSEQESIDVDIDAIVDWLEGLWQQDEEIRSTTSEADWQAFVDSVKSATGGW